MTSQVNPDTRDAPDAPRPSKSPLVSQAATSPPSLANDVWSRTPGPSAGVRWALGVGLAFIAGLAFMFPLLYIDRVFVILVICLIAMGAGFVSRSWWAVPAQAVALTGGGWVASMLLGQMTPLGESENWFQIFLLYALIPSAAFLIVGTSLGALLQMEIEGKQELARGGSSMSRWALAFSLTIAGGFFAGLYYVSAAAYLSHALTALLAAVACLMAGFVLRSWPGLVVTPILYVVIATLVGAIWVGPGGSAYNMDIFVTLPAVVMAAIGTAIGMRREPRRGGQRPVSLVS